MCRRKPIPFTLEQNFLSRLPKLRAKRDGSSRRPPCGTAAPAGRSCLDSRGHSFVCGPAQGRGPPSRYLRVGLPPCPVGEAVLATYRQVRLLEGSLEDRLRDLREDTEGTIRLGMHIVRARILVPPGGQILPGVPPRAPGGGPQGHGRSGRQARAGGRCTCSWV